MCRRQGVAALPVVSRALALWAAPLLLLQAHADVWDCAAALLREHPGDLSAHRQQSLLENLLAAASQMAPQDRWAREGAVLDVSLRGLCYLLGEGRGWQPLPTIRNPPNSPTAAASRSRPGPGPPPLLYFCEPRPLAPALRPLRFTVIAQPNSPGVPGTPGGPFLYDPFSAKRQVGRDILRRAAAAGGLLQVWLTAAMARLA